MIEYLLSGIIFILLDSCYLYFMKDYFNWQIKSVQGTFIQLNYVAAIITYAALVFGLNHFIIRQKKSVFEAMLLGFVIYCVYEFTNLSIVKNWSYTTAVIDTLWGTILFGLTTHIIYKLV